ncbi:putative Mg2+ transporter-C (MgtC) family protein [Pseudochelatococcus lubricantis]|uniref:Protein MgtC n=1 Tax=Pseudochelatococcus lubricantis TaxID=1538102 RepID=A0ABX0UYZ5_9HYPH|nr:MgtC/SapB family protein [Pseudochelatococcus lubricantis]NIJ57509.1 putative Mg2+ transporter-C (MgtC) family protein [Pseudochelatococcus lubricantis]
MAGNYYNALSIAPDLLVALFLGSLVGIERQWRQRHSGLTTHALVSLGAAAFTSLAILIEGEGRIEVRMGGQVVTGIGFLGAGLIMRDGLSVRGLSSAATLWATGAVGTLAGYGFVLEAFEVTVFILLINVGLPRLRGIIDYFSPEEELTERYYIIELKCEAQDEAVVRTKLLQAMSVHKLRLQSLESHVLPNTGDVEVEATVYSPQQVDSLVEQLVGDLSLSPLIFSTRWTSAAPQE